MLRIWVLLLLGIPVGARKGSYLLIAPESAIKGDDYPVTVVNNLNEQADVTVEMISKKGAYATKTGTISAKSSLKLDLRVTADFPSEFLLNMTLTYTQSNLIFVNSTSVPVNEASGFLNIQTDKKMYKKNQKVLIRTLALDRDLMPVNQNVTIYIKDPDGNRVEMWKNVEPESGVAKAEFLLSNDPVLGDWTIHAEQKHSDSEIVKSVVTFTVDKFVLPRFEVTVIGPPSLYPHSRKPFDVRVIARYTYGENVVGDAKIIVSMGGSKKAMSYKPLIEGTATFTLKPDELQNMLSYYNSEMSVKATVMEGSSRIELEGETTIQLTYDRIKIEIIGDDYFSPDVPYQYCMTVTDDRGQLMPEEDRQNYKVTIVRDWDKTLTQILELSSLSVTSSGHMYCGTASPPYKDVLNIQVTVKKQTDEKSSNTNYISVYKMSTSVNDTAGSIGLMLWDEQQNNLATKDVFNVGDVAKFKVYKSDESSSDLTVFYQVFSKGMSLTSGMVNFGQSRTAMLSVTVSRWMSPKTTIMVYGVSNGYLVTAMQKIKVNLNLNSQARISFGTSRAMVGSDVTLRVTTPEENSYVAVVAIDKGSDLLGTIDITEKEILQGLEMYAMGDNPVNGPIIMNRRKRRVMYPYHRSYSTAKVLRMAGVMCLTDATIYEEEEAIFYDDIFERQEVVLPKMNDEFQPVQTEGGQLDSGSDTKVRKNFPETWIWLDGKSGSDSLFEVQKTLPDSITSWVTRALVVSPTTGLHIPDVTQIESFKSFFLVIDTPASIIQGEVFEVKVLVFNYIDNGPEELQATVSIEGKIDNTAKIWSKELDEEPVSSEVVTKTLSVKRGQSSMFALWVRKLDTDKFSPFLTLTGEASAQTGGQNYMDILEKVVSAEPEGRRIQKTRVFNLETAGRADIPPVSISFPDNAVKGSKSVYVLAMGDLLGQALNNPERMISVPTGCGEQNIATTVPNIYVLQYLRATQAGETKLEDRMIQNIKQGYQQELRYKRIDYSFSAFGMSDPAGSTWLTAFVLKSFAEIHRILPDLVDPKVMKEATSWLNTQVGERGSVAEPGRVIHTEMQGSVSNSREKLAAFVLQCYAEVVAEFGSTSDPIFIAASQKMAAIETYLKSNIPLVLTNPYYTSLLTYALAVDGSSTTEVSKMTQQLMNNATSYLDGAVEMKCLGKNCRGGDSDGGSGKLPVPLLRNDKSKEPAPSSIEMTGYLLLTLLKTGRSDDAVPFLRWLNSKRNSLGGWYSTQDTVVGLKALSEFVRSRSQNKDVQIDVVITAKQNSTVLKTETIQITRDTRLLLQRAEFPISTTSLEIQPSQAGEAVLTVVWQYNLVNDLFDKNLQITIGKYTINDDIYDISPCVRYLGTGPSNMALVSVTMGSGMMADVEKLEQNPELPKVEVDGSVVHIYLNEVTKENQCMRFRAVQVAKVKDVKEVPVKAMLYYEPEVSAVVSYNPSTSNRVNFCKDQICAHAGHVTPFSLFLMITVSVAAMIFGRCVN